MSARTVYCAAASLDGFFAEPVPPLRLLGMRPFANGMAEHSYEVER